jgi:holo-[acyl-carrier protein] synthase
VIIGVGVDVCDVARFETSLRRTPELGQRLFTVSERYRPMDSLAARFAAKEALAKALGGPAGLSWHDAEVVTEDSGRPGLVLRGSVLAAAEARGAETWHLSLSHDAGIAIAFVVLEGDPVR